MPNLKPASNVTANAVITAFIVMILQLLKANMIVVPDSVMEGLPGLVGIIVPYLWDLKTGENAK